MNYIKDKYKTNEPRLRLTFTVMKDNIHELCDAVRLAADLNFSEGVQLRHLIGYKEELYDQIVPESDSPSNTKYVNHIEKAKALAKELHIPLTGDYVNTDIDHKGDHISVTSEEALHMDHLPCYEPFERLHVETDGKVRPCPSYSSNIFAGDLKKQTIWDVWNGEVMQHYRKNVNTINEPEGCKTCLSGHYRKRTRDDIWQQKDMDMLIYKRNNV